MTDLFACEQLLARLRRHEAIAKAELKRALGQEFWIDYKLQRDWVATLRGKAKIASCELRDYVRMLKIADLRHAQADQMRARASKLTPRGKRPYDLYERALWRLSELIEGKPSLAEHLDRWFTPYSWDGSSEISPEKE